VSSERRAPVGAAAGLGLAAAFLPQGALAHSPFPGIEGFYLGLLHPLSTPAQLLALLALGMALGWRWRQQFAVQWAAFAIAVLLGIVLGQLDVRLPDEELLLLLFGIVAAALSALHPGGFLPLTMILVGAVGLLIGLLSTPDPGPLRATIVTLAGSFCGANLALFYVSGAVGSLRERFTQHWVAVGLRVVGAWLAAIAVLMGSLALAA
jgi:hydrogenase/urease accessory protein HupE